MASLNCTIVGQAYATNSGSFGDYKVAASYAGANSSNWYVNAMKITTPEFSGKFQQLDLSLYIKSNYHANINLRYALCTSDANKLDYRKTYNEVEDEYQIASGILSMTGLSTSTYKHFSLTLEPETMQSGTDYYLIFWGTSNASLVTMPSTFENHTIAVIYDPIFTVELNHCLVDAAGELTWYSRTTEEVEAGASYTPSLITPPSTHTKKGATFKAWVIGWTSVVGEGVAGEDYITVNEDLTLEVYYHPAGSFIYVNRNGVAVKCEVRVKRNGKAVRCDVYANRNGTAVKM